MMQSILILLIAIISISILGIIVTTFLRRWMHEKKFSRLDRLKIEYKERLGEILNHDSASISSLKQEIEADALRSEALEETLYRHYNESFHFLSTIESLGYIEKYQSILASNTSVLRKAYAADRIGRFRHNGSVALLEQCAKKSLTSVEFINVVFKSLALIGTDEALKSIIILLPNVLKHHSISQKNAEMVLLTFSPNYVNLLLDACTHYQISGEKEAQLVMLDAISRSPSSRESIDYCLDILHSDDAELSVRALRHLGNVPLETGFDISAVIQMLNHPKWFVRVQAIGVLKYRLKRDDALKFLFLLQDSAWQVRRNFAELLVSYKADVLNTMVQIIRGNDNYAKESIAEAIQMEGFFAEILGYITPESLYCDNAKIIVQYLNEIGLIDWENSVDLNSYPEFTRQTITNLLATKENNHA